jgi:toxin YoeB
MERIKLIDPFEENDKTASIRVIGSKLTKEVKRDPFTGTGKPEPLKHGLSGCWSRRIDQEHRLVYQIREDKIRILACRYQY